MKRIFQLSIIALLAFCCVSQAFAQKREHRAVWMSAYVADWPSGAITSGNADAMKQICRNNLDSLQRNNFTTIYYHVRAMCDAMYDSKYEPWSSYVSGTRGVAPAFDPFAFLMEEAHKRGIEVYAWLNPYRYQNSAYNEGWGQNGGDKNYENSHPEWLIKWKTSERTWTILNPALPEVKQRIVDVIADIMDKYDVDGIVFDDYFYQNGLPESYDAEDYAAYKEQGGTLSQLDWRRDHVNDMVRKVNNYIKSTKPWVRFGISPAGVACSRADVAEKYGVRPCPGSDWQYNGICSDPMAWISEGSIDFISPQVYWLIGNSNADFGLITPWWYEVTAKYNRHCYISQDLSNTASSQALFTEFLDQIDLTRTSDTMGAPGTVYFPWKTLKNRRGYDLSIPGNPKMMQMMNYLRYYAFPSNSLTPAVSWMPAECPGAVSNLQRNGRTLSWEGSENVRYAVYFVPKSVDTKTFRKDAEYLHIVSYDNTYEIPDAVADYPGFGIADADLDNYNYAVAILDRYGNEYSAFFVGQPVETAVKPTPTFPVQGEKAPGIFNFRWDGSSSVYEIIVSDDAEMKNVLARKEVEANFIPSVDVCTFEADKTYYWKVVARQNNAADVTSDVNSFTVDAFRVISPENGATGCDDNLTVEWTAMGDVTYHVQISSQIDMSDVVYETNVTSSSVQIPQYTLAGGTTYYLQVSAEVDGIAFNSSIVEFSVKVMPGVAPEFVNPAEEGVTLYSNSKIQVKPQPGVTLCTVWISSSNTFPARTSYAGSFPDFQFETGELSGLKVGSSYMKDGTTYYVRANVSYINEEGKTETSDWTVSSFVYSAEAGVEDIAADAVYIRSGEVPTLVAGQAGLEVCLYSLDGKLLLSSVTDAAGEFKFSDLNTGVYLVSVRLVDGSVKTLKMTY